MVENAVSARITTNKQVTITRLPENQRAVLEQDENGDVQVFERPFLSPSGGLEFDLNGQLRIAGNVTAGDGTTSTPTPEAQGARQW